MDYIAPENIFWLFSAAAQSIAAFVGFLATGYIFANDRLDIAVKGDETLVDIYEEIRKQYYSRLSILFVFTGLSIILSLSVTFLNSYDLGVWAVVIKLLIGGLDVFTIIWAIIFVLFIMHPDRVDRTAKQMIENTKDVFVEAKDRIVDRTLTRGEFLEKFIDLEIILRKIANQYNIAQFVQTRERNFLSLREIIRGMYQLELISRDQLSVLTEINRTRNLVVHGEIKYLELKQGEIIDEIKNNLDNLVEG